MNVTHYDWKDMQKTSIYELIWVESGVSQPANSSWVLSITTKTEALVKHYVLTFLHFSVPSSLLWSYYFF